MDPFVQMLRAAQGGQGLDNLARLYGLSLQQAQVAAEALMPAFAAGLQKRMGTPEGLAQLMVLMMRGPYSTLYDTRPASPADLTQPGLNALEAVFGSPEVSRAVMNHASASTGLGMAVMNQMTPGLAALMMGGLTKSLAASGALNQMLAGFLARASGQPEPTGNPWVDGLAMMMGTQSRQKTGNPWIDAFAEMMVRSPWTMGNQTSTNSAAALWQDMVTATLTAMGGSMPKAAPPPPPPPPPPAPPSLGQWPFQDYFAQLFTTGFPPGTQGTGKSPYDPFGLLPMAEFWGQMLDRSSGHSRRPPGNRK